MRWLEEAGEKVAQGSVLGEFLWSFAMVVVALGGAVIVALVLHEFGWWAAPFLMVWAACVEYVVKRAK